MSIFNITWPYRRARFVLFLLMVLCIPAFMIIQDVPVALFTSVFFTFLTLWVATFYLEGLLNPEDIPLLILLTATFTFGRAFSITAFLSIGSIPLPVTELLLALSLGIMMIRWRSAVKNWTEPLTGDLKIVLPLFLATGTAYLIVGYQANGALALRDIVFCQYILLLFAVLHLLNTDRKISLIIRMFIPVTTVLLGMGLIMDFVTHSGRIAFIRYLFDSREFNWTLYYGLAGIFVLGFFTLGPETKKKRAVLFITIYTGLLLMLLTEVRAGWVGMVPALLVMLFLLKKEIKVLVILIPLLTASLFLTDYLFKQQTINMIKSEVEGMTPGEIDTRAKKNVVFRLLIWKQTWDFIREKPVLGWGFGSFPQYYIYNNPLPSPKGVGPGSGITPAHNHILAIAYKMGFLGLAFFIYLNLRVFLLGVLYYRKCRSGFNRRFLAASLAGLVYWHGMALFFDVLESPPTGIFLWMLLGFIIGVVHLDRKHPPLEEGFPV